MTAEEVTETRVHAHTRRVPHRYRKQRGRVVVYPDANGDAEIRIDEKRITIHVAGWAKFRQGVRV